MDTINKLTKWLFWLMLIIGITSLLTWLVMLRPPVEVSYEIMFDSPRLVINEINATDARVNIEARITNTTGEMIELAYLEFEFFNERDNFVGSETEQLRLFSANQTLNVEMNQNVRNAYRIEVRFIEAEVTRP